MFEGCSNLTSLNVSNFDTSKVTHMDYMFFNCSNLTRLDVSNFDTSKVTKMSAMFMNCTNIKNIIGLNNWDVSNVTNFGTAVNDENDGIFRNCYSLVELDLSNWILNESMYPNGSYFSGAFIDCNNLTKISLPINFINISSHFNTRLLDEFKFDSDSNEVLYFPFPSLKQVKLKKGETFPTTLIYSNSAGDGYTGNWTALSEYNHTHGSDLTADISYGGNSYVSLQASYASITDEEWEANPDGIWFVWEKEGTDPAAQAYTSSDNFYTPEYDEDGNLVSPSEKFTSDGYWQKIDDSTYSYTFYVYDNTVAWKVYEEDYDGYTSDATSTAPIIISSGEEVATITNTANTIVNQKYGNITITSNVSDPMNVHTEGYLTYTVTITDADGNTLTGTKMYGDYAFKDGVAKVTIDDGGMVTIPNVPEGYHYTVSQDGNVYESSTTYTNEVGQFPSDGTENVTIDTTFNYVAPETSGSSMIVKNTVAGVDKDDYSSQEFNYVITYSGLEKGMTYMFFSDTEKTTPYISFQADSNGEATVNLTLKGDASVISTDIPSGATYVITQLGVDDLVTSMEASSTNGTVTSSKLANTEAGKDLSTGTEVSETSETALFSFTNTTAVKKDLTLTNKVTATSGGTINSDEEFEYTIKIEGLEPKQALVSNNYGRFVADGDGTVEKTITMKADEEFVLTDVPSGAKYTITKKANTKYDESVTINGTSTDTKTNSDKDSYISSTIAKTDSTTEDVVWTNDLIQTNTLAIKNNVSGNLGNKYTEFEYIVQFDKDTRASTVITAYNVEEDKNVAIAIDKNGQAKFTLHSGEELQFSGLSDAELLSMSSSDNLDGVVNTTIGVEQSDYTSQGYKTVHATDLDSDTHVYTVTYTNTKNTGVPTGNHIGTGLFAVFGIALVGIVFFMRKKLAKSE